MSFIKKKKYRIANIIAKTTSLILLFYYNIFYFAIKK